MYYFIGIGSNIDPYLNMRLILEGLLQRVSRLWIGRIIETDPVMVEGGRFLNTVVGFRSDWSQPEVKQCCNRIEVDLGRHREDPECKRKSRQADLDILLMVNEGDRIVRESLIPREKYVRPVMMEMMPIMGLECAGNRPSCPAGVELFVSGHFVGSMPIEIINNDPTGNGNDSILVADE
jgi:2-amino-4-hydroxy-6-hydroxymethyldihydropteridine diphosphokinase